MSTVLDIITDAMKNLGVISGSEVPDASEASDGLRTLNRMLDSWNTERLNIYTINAAVYDLTPQQMIYTIGPTAADFITNRPQRIESANIILNYNAPPIRVPLELLDDDQWAAIKLQQVPSTIPQRLYNDGSFPNSNLYLWGQPTAGLQLELYTWQMLSGFTDLTTTVAFPPGYEEAIVYNLALRMGPLFGSPVAEILPVITTFAQDSKRKIQSLNCQAPIMAADEAVMSVNRASTFNVFTGE
jgi:hypothetical protein